MPQSVFQRTVIIETASRVGQVALAVDEEIVAEEQMTESRRRASDLAVVADRLLKKQGWKGREVTAVVVGLGPGSYTGLRVGLASAKALAYAAEAAFFGVETYAAVAFQSPTEASSVVVIGDALQGKLFARDYRRCSLGEWEAESGLGVVSIEEKIASLPQDQWISGPGAELVSVRITKTILLVKHEDRSPRTHSLLQVAQKYPWAVNRDLWNAEPLYVRGSSAEEKRR